MACNNCLENYNYQLQGISAMTGKCIHEQGGTDYLPGPITYHPKSEKIKEKIDRIIYLLELINGKIK